MTARRSMSATRMSLILTVTLCVLIAVLLGGSGFVASKLVAQSSVATHAQIDADISAGDQARYEQLKKYLADNTEGISQTASLTAGLGTYTQSTIVATLGGYASQAGVTITNFDLGDTGGAVATASPGGGTTVNITLNSPVAYKNLIVFIRLVEQGLMPAQITGGDVSSINGNPTNVAVSQLSVKVVQ